MLRHVQVSSLGLGLGLLVTTLGAGGCMPDSYCVRRAAVVPIPAPNMRPARQASGYVEANVGSETAAFMKAPKRLEGANVGLYVPRQQLSGYLLASPHPMVSFGLSYETGFADTAVPISRGLIDPPRLNIGGTGLNISLNFKLTERVTLGWSCDVWFYSVSSRVNYIESSTCEGLPDPNTWPSKQVLSFGFTGRTQLAVGLDFRWSYLTLGAGIRNQLHNVGESQELHYVSETIGPKIRSAPYPYVYAGWEIRATDWFHIGVAVYQPLNFDPVIYAPIFGLNFRITHVSKRWSRPRNRGNTLPPPPPPLPPMQPLPYAPPGSAPIPPPPPPSLPTPHAP